MTGRACLDHTGDVWNCQWQTTQNVAEILLIEDDFTIRALLSVLLRASGHSVREAHDGCFALRGIPSGRLTTGAKDSRNTGAGSQMLSSRIW
jgi:DNA-binding NtrC family response regulator